VRLFQQADFLDVLLAAAAHFEGRNLTPAAIEKDYYITEALRCVSEHAGARILFKGGTSLSKGWGLIERFSEDIDLFLDPLAFDPPLGRNGIDREVARLCAAIDARAGLRREPERSSKFGGVGRNEFYSYVPKLEPHPDVPPRILLEVGTASGREPSALLPIRSYVSEFLDSIGDSLGAQDESPFTLRLLHFRRTFVEKLFAIHSKVELYRDTGRPIGSQARHYYDLYQLGGTAEVQAMLRSEEADVLRADYDRVSREHFARDYRPPPGLRLKESEALFPTGDLDLVLRREYERQCRTLCFGAFPSWDEVRARLESLRPWL
jgi:hypothetical protein